MRIERKYFILIFAIVGFIVTLCLAELPPYGKQVVAAHNNGYGTFDMTSYNSEIVESVLEATNQDGWKIYNRYYICDFFFILFFGMLQLVISWMLYSKGNIFHKMFALGIPILRGILDAVENVLLLYIINDHPNTHSALANLSSHITTVKFAVVPVWIAIVIIGVVLWRKNKKAKEV